jgi:glucose-1-phosphate adenylyltransferase
MICDKNNRIIEFQEKPKNPKSNLASMGIYIFKWKVLRKYLKDDAKNPNSDHDFGKNIIPQMLEDERRMQAYRFQGYWRDVGTLASLHQANMDLVNDEQLLDLHSDPATRIYTEDTYSVPQYIGPVGSIKKSITNQGAVVLGTVSECVISNEAIVEEEAVCTKCVIMSGARIKVGAKIHNAIIAPNSVIERGEEINLNSDEIVLIARKG